MTWEEAIKNLKNAEDVDLAVAATFYIEENATASNIPELFSLLQDESFFVREAVAVPLARLEGTKVLPLLFYTLTRGRNDYHDNDGLSNTIANLLESDKQKSAEIILKMIDSEDNEERLNAVWAYGFVASEIPIEPLLDCFRNDSNAHIRAAAAGSLSSFKSDPEIVDELIYGLYDVEEQVCISSISSLGYLGDEKAIRPLKELVRTSEGRVKEFAEYALEQLQSL